MTAFEEMYARHYRDVYRFALFLTSDPASAEDLAADTFVRAWSARDQIRQPTVKSYLLTITRNLYRDSVRRRRPVVTLDAAIPDGRPPFDARVEHASRLRSIRAQLNAIAVGDRRALLMRAVRGMSYGEIARRLGISVGAVKSRIFRARGALERTR